jgi:hypothetical protein
MPGSGEPATTALQDWRQVVLWFEHDLCARPPRGLHAELRFWNPPGTPPAQVTATAIRALQAVTGTAPDPGPRPG